MTNTYSAKLTPAREKKLVEALSTCGSAGMVAREIREITNWDGTHMSIKRAVQGVGDRNGFRTVIKERDATFEDGTRRMKHYWFEKPVAKKPAARKPTKAAAAEMATPKKTATSGRPRANARKAS